MNKNYDKKNTNSSFLRENIIQRSKPNDYLWFLFKPRDIVP